MSSDERNQARQNRRIERWGQWLLFTVPVVARIFHNIAVRNLARNAENPKAIPHLAHALGSHYSEVAQNAENALRSLKSQEAIDEFCASWSGNRDRRLGNIMVSCRYHARAPLDIHVLSSLKSGLLEELKITTRDAVASVVKAMSDTDEDVRKNAENALRSLKSQKAIDALIDQVLNEPQAHHAANVVNEQGFRHSVEGRWFLFLALAGLFDEYIDQDYEFHVLRPEFYAAPAGLQARIREAIVKSGDTRMNALFYVEKRGKLLADLSENDAEVLLKVNARNRNWNELFKFLWVLPARHIQKAVKAMMADEWRPEDPDKAALFSRLMGLVQAIGDTVPEKVQAGAMCGPVIEKWMKEGEAQLANLTENEVRRKLTENQSLPVQVAALGGLRKKGILAESDLNAAARSQHWPVRLAAASLGGQLIDINQGGSLWVERIAPALDAEAVWGGKPCEVTREGLEVLQKGLTALPEKKAAGGLGLLEAIAAHYTAHDIEVEIGARITVSEDAFELGG